MHAALLLASLGLAFIGSCLCSRLLYSRFSFARSWDGRRMVQMAGMLLPTLILGIAALVMAHFIVQVCFISSPPLDTTITLGVSITGALGILGAIALNSLRATLLPWHITRRTWEGPMWLREMVAKRALDMGLQRTPRIRVTHDKRPWALVAGLLRPTLVISSGLAALLDTEELDAVLSHELAHIKRGDLWLVALAGALYDLTWFLPSTRSLYRSLLVEQEVACDDHVLGDAQRLALASALVRIWKVSIDTGVGSKLAPRWGLGLLGSRRSESFEERVQRLMQRPGAAGVASSSKALVMAVAVSLLFVIAQLWTISLAMEKMGCSLHNMI